MSVTGLSGEICAMKGSDWSFGGSWDGILNLMLLRKELSATDSAYYIIIFGGGCFIVSMLFLCLNLLRQYVVGEPFLKLRHKGFIEHVKVFFAWPLASAITGIVGVWLDILKTSIEVCVAVGFAWHIVLIVFFGERTREDKDVGAGE